MKFNVMELWVIVLAFILSVTNGQSVNVSRFYKISICNVAERVASSCSIERSKPTTIIRCLAECGRDSSCVGVSLEKTTGKCFIHQACDNIPPCSASDNGHDYYASASARAVTKYCVHGEWNSVSESCECELGTFGDRCDQANQHCDDSRPAVYNDEEYTVWLDPLNNGELYQVICNHRSEVKLARNAGGFNFNRTWKEYVNGFNSPDSSNLWLGLKAWHAFTNQPGCDSIVYIDLNFGNSGPSGLVYRRYRHFVVEDEDDNFSFSYSTSNSHHYGNPPPSAMAGDCLGNIENVPFSSWDEDNDGSNSKNCASLLGFGWWHPHDCDTVCNILNWGLDDWHNTPSDWRFAMQGINVGSLAHRITHFNIHYSCDD